MLLSTRTRRNNGSSGHLARPRGSTLSANSVAQRGFQRVYQYLFNRVFKHSISKPNLLERLRLEDSMVNISRRLALLVSTFIVTYILMVKGANMAAHAGSGLTLKKEFGFDDLGQLKTLEDMQDFLVRFTEKSQKFTPSSEAYVQRKGVVLLIPEVEAFAAPRVIALDNDQLPIKSNFTLSAWVVARRDSLDSRVLLQRALGKADGEPCWSWKYPNELQFGAADLGFNPEDFGLMGPTFKVSPPGVPGPPLWQMTHEAVTVSTYGFGSKPVARFYRDGVEAGNVTLPRSITDCTGLLSVGDSGLEVGQLAYRPWALAQREIEEVMRVGSTLAEVAALSTPAVQNTIDPNFPVRQLIRTTSGQQISELQDMLASREVSDHSMRDFIITQDTMSSATASGSVPTQAVSLAVNTTMLGMPDQHYFQVVKENTFAANGAHLSGMPPVGTKGLGFSFSTWVLTDGSPGYIISQHINRQATSRCYGVHVVGNRITWYVGSGKGNMKCFIPASRFFLNKLAYRHIVYVAKAPKTLQIYLDGELLCEKHDAWADYTLAQLECSGPVAVGMRYPYNHLLTGTVSELRVYPEHPLTQAEVRVLAAERRECRFPEEIMDERYRNSMQRGCSWYQRQITLGYTSVCDREAAQKCPIACARTVSCFQPGTTGSDAGSTRRMIWDRIRIIEPRTLCLSANFGGAAAFKEACRGAKAAGWSSETLAGLQRLLRAWPNIPFANDLSSSKDICSAFQEMVDPYCEWGYEGGAEDLASAINQSKSFSLSFWRKGPRTEQVFGFAGNPPQPFFGLWASARDTPALDVFGFLVSACKDVDVQWSDIYNVPLVDNEWNHHVYIVGEDGSVNYVLNGNIGGTKKLRLCFHPEILSALFFEEGGLVSPIQVWTRRLQPSEVQSQYYVEKPIFESFPGPIAHDRNVYAPMRIDVSSFRQRLVLLAPPIVKQRRKQTSECSEAPRSLLKSIEEVGCTLPFECRYDGPRLACRSEEEEKKEFFGTKPTGEGSFQVLASTLATPVVRPRSEVVKGSDFIDLQTTQVTLSAMFYLPIDLTVTVAEVTFDLESVIVSAETTVQHLSVGEAELWKGLVVLLFLILGTQFIMSARAMAICIKVFRQTRVIETQLMVSFFELLEVVAFVSIAVARFTWVTQASSAIKSLVRDLSVIPWGDTGTALDTKMELFFEATEMVQQRVWLVENLRSATTMLMLILVVQMVAVLHGHPRMQMITGTICHAFDPLVHFTIVTLMLFLMFGLIGMVAFGSERPEFQDLGSGMGALFDFLMGEYPFDWTEVNNIFALYFIAYMCVFFFLLLNFILAIIQDGYSAVKVAVDQSATEHSFPWDFIMTWKVVIVSKWRRWPSSGELARRLALQPQGDGEQGLGIDQLTRTGLFQSEASIRSYIIYRRQDSNLLRKRDSTKVKLPLERELRIAIDSALWDVPELFKRQKEFRQRPATTRKIDGSAKLMSMRYTLPLPDGSE